MDFTRKLRGLLFIGAGFETKYRFFTRTESILEIRPDQYKFRIEPLSPIHCLQAVHSLATTLKIRYFSLTFDLLALRRFIHTYKDNLHSRPAAEEFTACKQ